MAQYSMRRFHCHSTHCALPPVLPVRDDSLGPSVPAAGHTGAGKSGQLSVLDFVLHGVHVHVHVVVDFLVLACQNIRESIREM